MPGSTAYSLLQVKDQTSNWLLTRAGAAANGGVNVKTFRWNYGTQ